MPGHDEIRSNRRGSTRCPRSACPRIPVSGAHADVRGHRRRRPDRLRDRLRLRGDRREGGARRSRPDGPRQAGSATGWIGGDPGVSFVEVEKALGLTAARQALAGWRRAALDFAALHPAARHQVRVRAAQGAATSRQHPSRLVRLKREQKARRDAGLERRWSTRAIVEERARPRAAGARSATHAGGVLDPYRAASASPPRPPIEARRFSSGRRCGRSRSGARTADVTTAGGRSAPIAWSSPPACRRRSSSRSRGISGFAPARPGADRARAGQDPPAARPPRGGRARSRRAAARGPLGGRRAAAGGRRGHRATPPSAARKVIVQRTGQLMYELSTIYPDISGILPAYGWERAVRAGPPTACRSSARTAISRGICSRSATRATA